MNKTKEDGFLPPAFAGMTRDPRLTAGVGNIKLGGERVELFCGRGREIFHKNIK